MTLNVATALELAQRTHPILVILHFSKDKLVQHTQVYQCVQLLRYVPRHVYSVLLVAETQTEYTHTSINSPCNIFSMRLL